MERYALPTLNERPVLSNAQKAYLVARMKRHRRPAPKRHDPDNREGRSL